MNESGRYSEFKYANFFSPGYLSDPQEVSKGLEKVICGTKSDPFEDELWKYYKKNEYSTAKGLVCGRNFTSSYILDWLNLGFAMKWFGNQNEISRYNYIINNYLTDINLNKNIIKREMHYGRNKKFDWKAWEIKLYISIQLISIFL